MDSGYYAENRVAELKNITWTRAAEQVDGHNLSYKSAFSSENTSDYFNICLAKHTSDNATISEL